MCRYIHQANVLLANFFSLLTFGLLFTGLTAGPAHSSPKGLLMDKN
jgi:hypothetical protein